MLNRRTLRIKAMQAVFAYWQCKNSDYNITRDQVAEAFAPDLNSMEVQDKELLEQEKKEALSLFESQYRKKGVDLLKGSTRKIEEVVRKNIDFYYNQVRKDFTFIKQSMVLEAEKINDRYLMLLGLIEEFAVLAENDTRLQADNFVKNLLIHTLRNNSSLESVSLRKGLDWEDKRSEVRQWYREVIKTDDSFKTYLGLAQPTRKEDVAIVNHIAKNLIFKNDVIMSFMEEDDLNWAENKAIVKSMVVKTLKSFEEQEDIELSVLSYNWEEDREFFIELFQKTATLDEEYTDLVAKKTKNWDVDRIAILDKIILHMSICEMVFFSSIPIKVTINEYIEISKNYSTPRSKQFINGILDVIAQELTDRGAIRKSGRGLIDNK